MQTRFEVSDSPEWYETLSLYGIEEIKGRIVMNPPHSPLLYVYGEGNGVYEMVISLDDYRVIEEGYDPPYPEKSWPKGEVVSTPLYRETTPKANNPKDYPGRWW